MTPVSFVKTTESYEVGPNEVSLVTIYRQASYVSAILRRDYGIMLDYKVCRLGHHLGRTYFRIGPVSGAVHSCNSWLCVKTLFYVLATRVYTKCYLKAPRYL